MAVRSVNSYVRTNRCKGDAMRTTVTVDRAVCRCGHTKTMHRWGRAACWHNMTPEAPCACSKYVQADAKAQPHE